MPRERDLAALDRLDLRRDEPAAQVREEGRDEPHAHEERDVALGRGPGHVGEARRREAELGHRVPEVGGENEGHRRLHGGGGGGAARPPPEDGAPAQETQGERGPYPLAWIPPAPAQPPTEPGPQGGQGEDRTPPCPP